MPLSKDSFDKKALEKIGKIIQADKETISIAESVTSGLVQSAMATIPNASKFYQGGITAYNIGQKYKHLGVEPLHAESVDCVSQKVADEMAMNVCNLFQSDWGIAITGYAVPAPESNGKLFAFFSIAYKNKVILKKKIIAKEDESLKVQLFFVNEILQKFSQYLGKKAK